MDQPRQRQPGRVHAGIGSLVNRPKIQGTAEETWNARFYGGSSVLSARRIAEGGALDEGDVEVIVGHHRVIIESKARANLNLHQTLNKAISKANTVPGTARSKRDTIHGYGVAVAHKKLVDKGGKRRVADGEPRVVAITPEYFRHLLECEAKLNGVTSAIPESPPTLPPVG